MSDIKSCRRSDKFLSFLKCFKGTMLSCRNVYRVSQINTLLDTILHSPWFDLYISYIYIFSKSSQHFQSSNHNKVFFWDTLYVYLSLNNIFGNLKCKFSLIFVWNYLFFRILLVKSFIIRPAWNKTKISYFSLSIVF